MHITSLNIREDIFELMENQANEMNISIAGMIKQLIARFSKRYTTDLEYRECSVAYQPLRKQRHLFVITYSEEEYEQVLDIRKVWKLSVSFFVMMAFLHYLWCSSSGDPEESSRVLKNSYMLTNYNLQNKLVNKTQIFILIWGKDRIKPLLE